MLDVILYSREQLIQENRSRQVTMMMEEDAKVAYELSTGWCSSPAWWIDAAHSCWALLLFSMMRRPLPLLLLEFLCCRS